MNTKPTKPTKQDYDVVVVGAGPAGLSSAIFAASEGLSVLVTEHGYVGGQSASSSLIENYYGFPKGISGAELAERGKEQALRLGAELVEEDVCCIEPKPKPGGDRTGTWVVTLHSGPVRASAVILACGLAYRKLNGSDGLQGVFYGPSTKLYEGFTGQQAVVIGGGNSAGQAAQALTEHDCRVVLVVRGSRLEDSMSDYLIKRVRRNPKIEIKLETEFKSFDQDQGKVTAVVTTKGVFKASAVFVFVGQAPDTKWLKGCCKTNDHGFVVVDSKYQTSALGLFAVGDVHEGARNRVAAAVGEGSIATGFVHQWIETQKTQTQKVQKGVEK